MRHLIAETIRQEATPPASAASSERYYALGRMSKSELENTFLCGYTPEPEKLAGWEFRGLNTPFWARIIGVKKFIKGFYRTDDNKLYGYNCPVVQNAIYEPWIARPDDSAPKHFGFYEVYKTDPTAVDNAYLHALLLDYGKGPVRTTMDRFDPTRGLRDYLVKVDADNDDLLLGKAYYALGPARVGVSYFVLERHRPGTYRA